MPVFTAIATAVSAAVGGGIFGAIAGFVVRGVVTLGISRLATKMLAPKNDNTASSQDTQGVRQPLEPQTYNSLPVVYGSAFIGGAVTDAHMSSTDGKTNNTMWYCMSFSEKTGTLYSTSAASVFSFGKIYWGQNEIVFKADGVTIDYTVDTTGGIDDNMKGLVKIYLYKDGGSNPTLPTVNVGSLGGGGGGTLPGAAYTVWGGGSVWNVNNRMEGTVFALIRVDFNREKNVTGLANTMFQVQNTMKDPGDVFYDYITNMRYGAGIATAEVDTTSVTALTTYSQEPVTYNSTETLPDRYQINGIIRTSTNVLSNLESVTAACGSWLSYDIGTGKWGVVINKAFAGTVDLNFDDSNILGQISLSGTSLDSLYNSVEIKFPHRDIRDQIDVRVLELPEEDRNPNEPNNRLNLDIEMINEPVQAQILADLELHANRLEKVVVFSTDFSKINTEAGDIIAIYNDAYGWNVAGGYPDGKDFRVLRVIETEDESGGLVVQITAKEYDDVYNPGALTRPAVTTDIGIVGDGVFGEPAAPTIEQLNNVAVPSLTLHGIVPTGDYAPVYQMEFYATSDTAEVDDASRKYFFVGSSRYISSGIFGLALANLGEPLEEAWDIKLYNLRLPVGSYYFKVRCAGGSSKGPFSDPSSLLEWQPNQVADSVDPGVTQVKTGNTSTTFPTYSPQVVSSSDIDFGTFNPVTPPTPPAPVNFVAAGAFWDFYYPNSAYAGIKYSVDGTWNNASNKTTLFPYERSVSYGIDFNSNRLGIASTTYDNSFTPTGGSIRVDYSPDRTGTQDHDYNVFTTTENMVGIAGNGANWVAVGNGGAIYNATNMTSVTYYVQPNWTEQTSGTANNLWDAAYGSSKWVVVGAAGTILTSADSGVTWTARTSGTANVLYAVWWNGTKFVAAGSSNTVLYSSDGVSWSAGSGITGTVYDVCFGNSVWLAVGGDASNRAAVWTSSDGQTWTSRTIADCVYLNCCAYDATDNIFLAAGDYEDNGAGSDLNYWRSNSTGTSWTRSTNGETFYRSITSLAGY